MSDHTLTNPRQVRCRVCGKTLPKGQGHKRETSHGPTSYYWCANDLAIQDDMDAALAAIEKFWGRYGSTPRFTPLDLVGMIGRGRGNRALVAQAVLDFLHKEQPATVEDAYYKAAALADQTIHNFTMQYLQDAIARAKATA